MGRNKKGEERFTEKMTRKIDSTAGRVLYGMRLAIGEPPFAYIRHAMKLDRFSLRGKPNKNRKNRGQASHSHFLVALEKHKYEA